MNTITDIFKDKGVVNAIALTKNYKRRTPPTPVEPDASQAYAFIGAVTVIAGLIYCFLSTPSHQEITQDTRHTAKKTKKSKKSKKSKETKETKEQIQEKKLENYHVLSKRLIHPHQEHTLEELYFWKQVFEYLDPQLNQQRELRFLCCLFRDSIPPPPLWTSCPTHNNLDKLFNRLQQVFNEDRTKVPKMVVLTADHYIINNNSRNSLERYVEIGFPIALIGKGINNTIIEYGGFKIQDATIKSTKLTREKVILKDLSIDYATGNGVLFHNHSKLELEMERVKITNCNKNGLWMKSGRANLIDCVIEKNKLNGIYAGSTATRMGSNVFVVLSGPATKIRVHKNGWYGSKTRDSSCAIKVKYPLTITKCFGITNDQDAVVKKSSGLKPDCWSCNSQGKKIKGYERHNYSDMKVECSECDGTGTIGKPFGGPGSLFESRARLCGLLNKNEWNGLEVEVDEWNNKKERHLVYIKQIEGTAGTSKIQAYIKLENLKFLRVHTRKVESYSSHNPY